MMEEGNIEDEYLPCEDDLFLVSGGMGALHDGKEMKKQITEY